MKRNESYYSLTLFIPILVMTLLSPCGLILPVDAGEKMGLQVRPYIEWRKRATIRFLWPLQQILQITVLLTMVIYVEVMQHNIPVFDSYGNTPLMLVYFIVTIITICVCLLVSTHTLFVYHVNSYEVGCSGGSHFVDPEYFRNKIFLLGGGQGAKSKDGNNQNAKLKSITWINCINSFPFSFSCSNSNKIS